MKLKTVFWRMSERARKRITKEERNRYKHTHIDRISHYSFFLNNRIRSVDWQSNFALYSDWIDRILIDFHRTQCSFFLSFAPPFCVTNFTFDQFIIFSTRLVLKNEIFRFGQHAYSKCTKSVFHIKCHYCRMRYAWL